MKIGLWNIDHPEYYEGKLSQNQRFIRIKEYLKEQDCDIYILCETNAALTLDGYFAFYSDESPYINKSRNYNKPNAYYQVGVYSRVPARQRTITEPINGVLCEITNGNQKFLLYGNVITIKDRWKKDSDLTYSDRLQEQLSQFESLADEGFIIGGDLNLRKGWANKNKAYNKVKQFAKDNDLCWPTSERTDTVQHMIHSNDLITSLEIDASVQHDKVRKNRLSDHPFVRVDVKLD
ncbi:endonuclease/exonuclease/phosphatase family protein [Gracilimonas aurantiaca]|uniref:endonuclease/exonuclease/phosphatase family protein n=1 Tax=Gracilimonas aurantiaca TaxID=3234185 RepID=UPI00390CBE2C